MLIYKVTGNGFINNLDVQYLPLSQYLSNFLYFRLPQKNRGGENRKGRLGSMAMRWSPLPSCLISILDDTNIEESGCQAINLSNFLSIIVVSSCSNVLTSNDCLYRSTLPVSNLKYAILVARK